MDQRFAEQWVLNFARLIDSFGVRVFDADKVFYFESVELDIDILVDAGAECFGNFYLFGALASLRMAVDYERVG